MVAIIATSVVLKSRRRVTKRFPFKLFEQFVREGAPHQWSGRSWSGRCRHWFSAKQPHPKFQETLNGSELQPEPHRFQSKFICLEQAAAQAMCLFLIIKLQPSTQPLLSLFAQIHAHVAPSLERVFLYPTEPKHEKPSVYIHRREVDLPPPPLPQPMIALRRIRPVPPGCRAAKRNFVV